MTSQKDIAILFFSRTAEADAKAKSWVKSERKNKEIAKILIQNAKQQLQKVDADYFAVNQYQQRGGNFGSKLGNAIADIFNQGYSSVIAIGNDFVRWESINWTQTIDSLRNKKNVLGKNKRGGTYLIGIHRDHFRKQQFESLPWQTSSLFQSLLESIDSDSILLLPEERDINTWHDLVKIIDERDKATNLVIILLILLFKQIFTISFTRIIQLKKRVLPFCLRAPPSFSLS